MVSVLEFPSKTVQFKGRKSSKLLCDMCVCVCWWLVCSNFQAKVYKLKEEKAANCSAMSVCVCWWLVCSNFQAKVYKLKEEKAADCSVMCMCVCVCVLMVSVLEFPSKSVQVKGRKSSKLLCDMCVRISRKCDFCYSLAKAAAKNFLEIWHLFRTCSC